MKRVLILTGSPAHRDPRVRRQVDALQGHAMLTVAAYTPPPGEVEFVAFEDRELRGPLRLMRGLLKLTGLHNAAYWLEPAHRRLLEKLRERRFDVIIANDFDTLPLASRLNAMHLVFDAHEYAPRQFENDWKWRLVSGRHAAFVLGKYLRFANHVFTVSSGLAGEFRREYGMAAEVMPNAAPFREMAPSALLPGRIRLVHHGVANPARHIEDMLEMMRYLDARFSLDLYMVPGPDEYMRKLHAAAADPRVRILPPVPMEDIIPTINNYDVGIAYFRPTTFNLKNTLPNKFFEYVQARLAIAVGPTPDMADLVGRFGIGVVAPEFSPAALARCLSSLDDASLWAMKKTGERAARELSFEHYADRFRAVVLGFGATEEDGA